MEFLCFVMLPSLTIFVVVSRLANLEELVINENVLTELPTCIGFLRNLHTLIADCNRLVALPDSICSCLQLRILSLAENNLASLPDEIGRLSSLQVFNLCSNRLKHLPTSLSKITGLKSLWLSENQNKPLVQLHAEYIEGERVLTCVLLPQREKDADEDGTNSAGAGGTAANTLEPPTNVRRRSSFLSVNIDKPLIDLLQQTASSSMLMMATTEAADNPQEDSISKLLRQPTPYAKDRKVHARHARNLILKHLDQVNRSQDEEDAEVVNDDDDADQDASQPPALDAHHQP